MSVRNPGPRVRQAVDRRLQMFRNRGTDVFCPVCGRRFARFRDDWNRPNALCWRCGSHERHRAQWLLFERRPRLLADARAMLHFAPEWCLRRRLAALPDLRYVTGDLFHSDVDLRLDIESLDLPNASFDAVICSHVLEHVSDDEVAMKELRRITAPGGWCLVMVPLDLERDATYEDPSITTPIERERAFLQHDHVRLYGPDIRERLAQAGFEVECIRPKDEFGDSLFTRCRLIEADYLLLARPTPAPTFV